MENSQEYVDYYFLEGLLLEEPPDKYSCPICLSPVQREAFLTQCCGKHFCRECISRLAQSRRPCPMCKSLPVMIFPNKERQREINQLRVRCPVQLQDKDKANKSPKAEVAVPENESDCVMESQAASCDPVTCDWQGELGQVDDHLKTVHKDDKRWKACCAQPLPPSSQQQAQGQGQRRVCYFHLNQGMQQMNIRTHAHVGGSGQVPLIHVHGGSRASTSTSTTTAGSLNAGQDNHQGPHHTAQGSSTSPTTSASQGSNPSSQDTHSSHCQCGAHRGVTTPQATPTSQSSAHIQAIPIQVTTTQGVSVQPGNVVTIQVPILMNPPLPPGSSAGPMPPNATATPTADAQSVAPGQGQESQDASQQAELDGSQHPPPPQPQHMHQGPVFRPGRVVIRHGRGPHNLVFRGGPGGGHTHFPGPPPRHHHHHGGHGHHHHPPPHGHPPPHSHPPPHHPPPHGHPPPYGHPPPHHPPPHPHLPPDYRDGPHHRPHHPGGHGHHHHHHHRRHH